MKRLYKIPVKKIILLLAVGIIFTACKVSNKPTTSGESGAFLKIKHSKK